MKTEITILALPALDEIKSKLVKDGFKKTEFCTQDDYYFTKHSISRAKKMRYSSLIGDSILVREIVGEGTKKYIRRYIEYKKKVLDRDQRVIAEEKIECRTDSLAALKIFALAGLTQWEHIFMTCYIYERGEESLAIQDVDGLGTFIEVEEFKSHAGLDPQEKMKRLIAFVDSLGIEHTEDYSCKKVFLKFKKDYQ